MEPLRGKVVVITGASSGIGRATALELARRGAYVVLAARRELALKEVADECMRLGTRALAVPADVRAQDAVDALAGRALEVFETIDVWVNNAGVYLAGRLEDVPPEIFRNVFEINFFGTVHGCRAVLPHFRERGRGVVVNNASVAGRVGAPYFSAYVASKWAIRGFSESLRQELRDQPGIHVSVVLPASIDTPFFQHAANYTGRALKPLAPTYPPEKVARAIVGLAERPRRELVVGGFGRLLTLQHTLAPGVTERLFAAQVERDHFRDEPVGPTPGTVVEPMPDWTSASGGWRNGARSRPRLALVGAAAIALPAAVTFLRRRSER